MGGSKFTVQAGVLIMLYEGVKSAVDSCCSEPLGKNKDKEKIEPPRLNPPTADKKRPRFNDLCPGEICFALNGVKKAGSAWR